MALNKSEPPEIIDATALAEARKKKRHREGGGAWFLLLIGLAILALGRMGLLWPRYDVFAQFTIQGGMLAAAGFVGLWVPRFKGITAGVLAVVLLVAYGLWPWLNLSRGEGALIAGEKRLKVAQFNIGGERSDVVAVRASLVALNADLISLVETGDKGVSLMAVLKAQYPYQVDCFDKAGCEMAIISKLPLGASKVAFAEGLLPVLKVSLGPDFGGLLVASVHTTRFPHIASQFTQFRAIAKVLDGEGGRLLLVGDFNATPQSRVMRDLADALGLSIGTYLPSWPATYGLPQLAIDHLLYGPSLRTLASEEAGQGAGSDHLPVALVLAVASGHK